MSEYDSQDGWILVTRRRRQNRSRRDAPPPLWQRPRRRSRSPGNRRPYGSTTRTQRDRVPQRRTYAEVVRRGPERTAPRRDPARRFWSTSGSRRRNDGATRWMPEHRREWSSPSPSPPRRRQHYGQRRDLPPRSDFQPNRDYGPPRRRPQYRREWPSPSPSPPRRPQRYERRYDPPSRPSFQPRNRPNWTTRSRADNQSNRRYFPSRSAQNPPNRRAPRRRDATSDDTQNNPNWIQTDDEDFIYRVRIIYKIIKSQHHLHNVTRPDPPPLIRRTTVNLATFIMPAGPTRKTKTLLQGNARNWECNTLAILKEHYEQHLLDDIKELALFPEGDWKGPFQIATNWAKRNFGSRLTEQALSNAKTFISSNLADPAFPLNPSIPTDQPVPAASPAASPAAAPPATPAVSPPSDPTPTPTTAVTSAAPVPSPPFDALPQRDPPPFRRRMLRQAQTSNIAAPSTTVPDPSVSTDPVPASSASTDPAPSISTDPAPAPSVSTDPAPAPSIPTDSVPAPSVSTDPVPAPSVSTDPAPAPSVSTDPAPAPSVSTDPVPATSASADPVPQTIPPTTSGSTTETNVPARKAPALSFALTPSTSSLPRSGLSHMIRLSHSSSLPNLTSIGPPGGLIRQLQPTSLSPATTSTPRPAAVSPSSPPRAVRCPKPRKSFSDEEEQLLQELYPQKKASSAPTPSSTKPSRHMRSKQKVRDWSLSARKSCLIIGDSNLSRIPSFNAPDVQVDSFPGATFFHASHLLRTAAISSKVTDIVLAFGLNNRSQKSTITAINQLQRTVYQAQQRFPRARCHIPVINFSPLLPCRERLFIKVLNQHIRSHQNYIPPLNTKVFQTEKDNIHWSKDTAQKMFEHWMRYLKE